MCHIAHLRKQFKSIIITLIKRRKKKLLILWEFIFSSFEETWIPFIQGCFVLRLIEISSVVLEKRIFIISSMYFRYFVIISAWKRVGPFIWTNLHPLHPLECFVPSLVEIGPQWFLRRRFFNFVNVFSLIRNYLPLEKGGALHLNKLKSPTPKDALCQVWLKLA